MTRFFIGKFFPGQNFADTDTEFLSEKLKHFNVRHIISVFPTGDGFVGNSNFFAKGFLCKSGPSAKFSNEFSDFYLIHENPLRH